VIGNLLWFENDCRPSDALKFCVKWASIIRASLKTYQDRDEYNFDFEQGDSVHRRAGSPSCADTTQLRTKSVSV